MHALKHTLAISFIYRYYKEYNFSLITPTYPLSIYIYTYIRTHMNALACAYVDCIHNRFVQSRPAWLSLCCMCVCVYLPT